MMDFVIMTLSFTMGILLSTFVVCVIVLQPKVMKAYVKRVNKVTNLIVDELEEEYEKAEESE